MTSTFLRTYARWIGVAAVVATGCGPSGPGIESESTSTDPTATGGMTDNLPTTSDSDPSDPSDPSNPSDPTQPTDPTSDTMEETTDGPNEGTVLISVSSAIDVLFVIDNSGSMGEEQARLSANLEAFVNVLEGVGADYRIAVTTTDSGNPRCPSAIFKPEGGKFVLSSCLDRIDEGEFTFNDEDFSFACTDFCTKRDADLTVVPTVTDLDQEPKPRNWVERAAGQSNIQGVADNVEALQCYLPQGVAGCGFESHLESMFLALASATDKNSATNFGFMRDVAQLAVVIVSDETDCSWRPGAEEIFTTNKVFWSDPEAPSPTSAMCWNAGVSCTGGPGVFNECHAENFDLQGKPGADNGDAVLQPVADYIDFVKSIEQQKQQIDAGQRVQVALIAGVPVGYEDFSAEIPYEDSADPIFQESFGIGPGCILGDPGFPDSTAVPPVREREFAEAFIADPATERNLYSICETDYSKAFSQIAEGLADQIQPACMPNCVADVNPETPIVEPDCSVVEVNIITDEKNELPQCVEVGGEWAAPAGISVCFAALIDKDGKQTPSKIDDMAPACVDEGFNLQFLLVRTAPAAAGTVIEASCKLSDNKVQDCPNL